MPYNGSGTYTAPAADFPAVPNTLIQSTKFNNIVNDLATALTTAVTKDGQTTPTANLPMGGFYHTSGGIRAMNGSVGVPSISFINETDCGLYYIGADNIGFAIAGAKLLDLAAGSVGTAATTLALFNTATTTLNLGGAATTLNVGAAASTQTYTGQAFILTGANSTNNTALTVTNTSNAAAASHSYIDVRVGGTTSTGDPHIRFTVPSGTGWYLGADNSATDNLILGTGTTVGSTSILTVDSTGIAITYSFASSTSNSTFKVENTSNAAAASHAIVDITVGGATSTGDPQIRWTIPSGTSWYAGPDNSGSDNFFLGTGTAVGTTAAFAAGTALNVALAGSALNTAYAVHVGGAVTVGASQYGVVSEVICSSAAVTTGTGVYSNVNTAAAAFTMVNAYAFYADAAAKGAGSAITNSHGFYANNSVAGATLNIGFRGVMSAAAGSWNCYMDGSAVNHFAATVFVGKTSESVNTVGCQLNAAASVSAFIVTDSITCLELNRKTNDGGMINFNQDGTSEGSVTVSGTTIAYNTFLGSHWAQMFDGSKPDLLRGTVIESIDILCAWPGEVNDKLPRVKVSDKAGSPCVYGVFLGWDEDSVRARDTDGEFIYEDEKHLMIEPPTNDMYVAGVGAFIVRMAKGQSYNNGMLVESAGNGCARIQEVQIYGPNTLGKITSAVIIETYSDGSFIVPCKLDAG